LSARSLVLPFALVALVGDGPIEADQMQTERAVWAEPAKAAAELDRRVRQRVAYRQGILVVVDPDPRLPTVYALPAATPWLVACDVTGLTVGFGAGSQEAGTGVDLPITLAPLAEPQCRTLVPRAAAILAAVVQGN